MKVDDRICRICDGGPANECGCACGFRAWESPPEIDPLEVQMDRLVANLVEESGLPEHIVRRSITA